MKLLAIDNNDGNPVKPSLKVIASGSYPPLSRPLFLYVNKAAAQRPEVDAFLKFYYANARQIVEHPQVNYVGLGDDVYRLAVARLNAGETGSAIAQVKSGGPVDLAELYALK